MKKFWKKVLASSLAVVCTLMAGIAAIATGGFGLFNAAQVEGVEHNKQLSFGNFFGNGIMLTASAEESTAVTLTYGNDYNASFLEAKNRASIQPYGISISSGVTLTAKTGYQFGFYSVSNISAPTTATMLSGGWIDTYTTTSSGTYGIAIKKADDSDFNFSTDSIYIADYMDSTDSSIFGVSSSTPSTPQDPVYVGAYYTLKATVNDEATDKRVTWSIAWKNASSTWASGKTVTDYVTLTPTSEYALEAEVKMKEYFGEQIIVTVQSVFNPDLFATCTLDVIKPIEKISFTATNIINVLNGIEDETFTSKSYDLKDYDNSVGRITITDIPFCQEFSVHPVTLSYGVGTVDPDIYAFEVYLSVNEESLSTLNAATGYNFTYSIGYNGSENGADIWAEKITDSNYEGWCNSFSDYIECNGEKVDTYNLEPYAALMTYLRDNPNFSLFDLEVTSYSDICYPRKFRSKIYFDSALLGVAINELSLNESAVVFS